VSQAWARGSTAAWRRLRARVLADNLVENQGRCQVAIEGVCTGDQADTVHHQLGRAVTGDDPRYLVACCRACNLHIGEPKNNSPQHKRVSDW
jgi:hypothetical protein